MFYEIFGVVFFLMFGFIVIGTAILGIGHFTGWLAKWDSRHGVPTSVDMTLQQIYLNERVPEDANYMRARHELPFTRTGG